MKKLVIAIGCLTAIVLMSSCTADSVESFNNKTLKNQNQISPSATTDTIPIVTPELMDGVDDKDKTQG